MRSTKKKIIFGSVLFVALFLVFWFWKNHGEIIPERLLVTLPKRGPAVLAAYASGNIEPETMVPIAFKTSGRLIHLDKDEGDRVSQGDRLAQLEDADLKNALAEAQSQSTLAFATYRRTDVLKKQGVAPQADFDKALSQWKTAQATVQKIKAQLDFLTLSAPLSGEIIRKDGEVGQVVNAQQPVFWLSCCGSLRAIVEVDEEDIPFVRMGQRVLIKSFSFPKEVYEGRVLSITPKGDPSTRSFRVKISIPEPKKLMVGMTIEANLILKSEENALLVPASAVQNDHVWVVEHDKLRKKHVQTGIIGEDLTQILKGLNEKDRVVVSPQASFREGRRVFSLISSAQSEK